VRKISKNSDSLKIDIMRNENMTAASKAERGGDTSRTSSQGRKQSSGGALKKRGNPEMDEVTHSPKAGQDKQRRIGERKKA
jgi:hypothetical protein